MRADGRPDIRHPLGTEPRPDESLMGFVYRLAKRRGMPTGRMLAAEVGLITARKRASEEAIVHLAEIARVEPSKLMAISYGSPDLRRAVFLGVAINRLLLRGSQSPRAVCPACLSEDPYHRAVWDLTFSSACAVHACVLADACPDCGAPLRWQGVDLARCVCPKGNLARMPVVRIERDLLDGLRVACGLLGDVRHADESAAAMDMEPLRGLSPGEAVEFMFRLGMDLTGGNRRKMFSLMHQGKLGGPPHAALHLGLQGARNWPESFLAVPATVDRHWGNPAGNRALWSTAVSRWLDDLPPSRGKAVREVTAAMRMSGSD